MKRTLLLLFVAIFSLSLSAASKHPTVTHRYKNEPLEKVLSDVAKRTEYQFSYDPVDIDTQRPITISFKDVSAKSALKKLLGKEYVYTTKKGVITIARKPTPPVEIKAVATTPSSVIEDSLKVVSEYTDTLYSISCRKKTQQTGTETKSSTSSSKGHYVQAFAGLGHSGATVQAQYAYFFHENVGIYAGVGFSGTASYQHAQDKTYEKVTDSDGELYDHTVAVNGWMDRYTTHTVDIPIGLQFQYPFNDKLGLYAAVGAKIALPVYNQWRTVAGTISHNGYYAYSTHATVLGSDFEDRDFYTVKASEEPSSEEAKAYKTPVVAAMVTADLGLSFPVTEQIDVLTGLYAQVTCNDQRTSKDAEMGWTAPDGKYAHSFISTYPQDGIASTEQGKALLPYQVGVKVGIRWHYKEKVKSVPTYQVIEVCDTTVTLSLRRDTVLKPQRESEKVIKEIMRRSVIWFDLDKTEPKLQPADIIDQIAAVLKANPDQRILVNGHASKEGNERHNRRLSERRAKAVYDLLIDAGVPAQQMEMHSYSADIDFVEESGDAAAQHNISLDRRVEIIPIVEPEKH